MHRVTLFRDRSRGAQIALGGAVPAILGVVAGILVGHSATAYWVFGAVIAVGGFISGLEHLDGWGGADRGLVAGFTYGVALLVTHAITGAEAQVSLGSFPPLLAVVTAIIGMCLSAGGGRLARFLREREDKPQVDQQVTAAD